MPKFKLNIDDIKEIENYCSSFIIKHGEWKIYEKIFAEKYNVSKDIIKRVFTGDYKQKLLQKKNIWKK